MYIEITEMNVDEIYRNDNRWSKSSLNGGLMVKNIRKNEHGEWNWWNSRVYCWLEWPWSFNGKEALDANGADIFQILRKIRNQAKFSWGLNQITIDFITKKSKQKKQKKQSVLI